MSATPQNGSEDVYNCHYGGCDATRTESTSVKGSFCSVDCHYRAKGRKAIQQIKSDHTFCGTCFRRLKDIEHPPEDIRDLVDDPNNQLTSRVAECVEGIQFGTQHATDGVDRFYDIGDFDNPASPIDGTRLSCECGNVNPQDEHRALRDIFCDTEPTIWALYDCLRELEEKGAISERPSKAPLHRELERLGPVDWDQAAGRALYE